MLCRVQVYVLLSLSVFEGKRREKTRRRPNKNPLLSFVVWWRLVTILTWELRAGDFPHTVQVMRFSQLCRAPKPTAGRHGWWPHNRLMS